MKGKLHLEKEIVYPNVLAQLSSKKLENSLEKIEIELKNSYIDKMKKVGWFWTFYFFSEF